MKTISRAFAAVFGLAAVAAAVFGVYLSFVYRNAEPVLVTQPAAAVQRATALMDAVCAGDYEAAGKVLYGSPSLGQLSPEAGEAEQMIWAAYVDSLTYEFPGECYASDSGVAMDVNIHSLQISSVTANLKERSQTLLNARVAAAEDVDDIYDDDNNYREDFVMQVLKDATADALREDAAYDDRGLTLHMVYEDGQWWVVPEQELLSAVSGSVG